MTSTRFKKQDKSSIKEMFTYIAKDYDLMNNVISLGLNMYIKNKSVSRVKAKDGDKILDLCTGTGDIAIALAKKHPNSKIVAVDFTKSMLDIAKKRAKKYKNIEFIECDVTQLPFEENSFDVCTISFGLRNLPDPEQGFVQMRRVLKNDGILSCLDLGKPNWLFNIIFKPYFYHIMPILGRLFHGNNEPYKYLYRSNEDFPSQKELVKLLKGLGFKDVKNYNYAFGSMAQQLGHKVAL